MNQSEKEMDDEVRGREYELIWKIERKAEEVAGIFIHLFCFVLPLIPAASVALADFGFFFGFFAFPFLYFGYVFLFCFFGSVFGSIFVFAPALMLSGIFSYLKIALTTGKIIWKSEREILRAKWIPIIRKERGLPDLNGSLTLAGESGQLTIATSIGSLTFTDEITNKEV